MEAIGDNLVFVTGSLNVFIGAYLLRRSSLTRKHPEFFLGLALLLDGVSYGFSEFPFVAGIESIVEEFSFAGRIMAGTASVMIAVFVYRVFRPELRWARSLVGVAAVLVASGLCVSAVEGDWEGFLLLTYKGLWLDWLGGLLPYLWLSVEAFRKYAAGRRALRLGIGDALICNRFLLIGLYGSFATTAYLVLVPMYLLYELHGAWSPGLDMALGIVEIGCLAALWTSFAAPTFYRRWIGGEPV